MENVVNETARQGSEPQANPQPTATHNSSPLTERDKERREELKKQIIVYVQFMATRIHYKVCTMYDVIPAYHNLVRIVLKVKYGEDEYGNPVSRN